MTKEQIQAQYSQLAAQIGDLLFKQDAVEQQYSAIKDQMNKLRAAKAELEKAFAAAPSAVRQGAADAVETPAV